MVLGVPARYGTVLLVATAMGMVYGLRGHLGPLLLFVVDGAEVMRRGREEAFGPNCSMKPIRPSGPILLIGPKTRRKPLLWGPWEQGLSLSAYFWGFLPLQYPAHLLAQRADAKWLLFFSVLLNLICCALLPLVVIYTGWVGLCILRAIQGALSTAAMPSVHVIIECWMPPPEKVLTSIAIYSGTSLGMAVSPLLQGLLAAAVGWPWACFIMALLGIPWLILWAIFGSREYNTAYYISVEEKRQIQTAMDDAGVVPWQRRARLKFPCKPAFSSLPMWAIIVAHFSSNVGWYSIMCMLPYFLMYVLQKNALQVSALIASVFFGAWVVALDLGWVLTTAVQNGTLAVGSARKIANVFGSLIPGCCLLCLTFASCEAATVVVPLAIGVAGVGALAVGALANPMDIAPNFGGEIIAISNTIASLPGIFMPIMLGHMFNTRPLLYSWMPEFYMIFFFYLLMFAFYSIFASGLEQYWNIVSLPDSDEKETRSKWLN